MPLAACVVDRATRAEAARVWPVYDEVFGDAEREHWLERVWDVHTAREGFRLARAYVDGDLVGFAYGYTGRAGQWWTDAVSASLPAEVASTWLGGHFELVSIGVLPGSQGRGVGTSLMGAVTEHLPHERWLLMTTADPQDPARRFYDRLGWDVLGPGTREGTVVMGRETYAPEK